MNSWDSISIMQYEKYICMSASDYDLYLNLEVIKWIDLGFHCFIQQEDKDIDQGLMVLIGQTDSQSIVWDYHNSVIELNWNRDLARAINDHQAR